jgi:hypothetical protein
MLINPINQSYFLSEFRDKNVMLRNYWFSVFKHNFDGPIINKIAQTQTWTKNFDLRVLTKQLQ